MDIFFMILELLVALGLIAVVLLQSGRSAGVSGAIGGGAEQIFGKKKGMDEFLAKIATVMTVIFFILTLVIAILFS